MNDVDRTPRPAATQPTSTNDNESIHRNSIDDPLRSSPDDNSPAMSRSSSKASSIETSSKPPKPRRPTNYAERTSSISRKPSPSPHVKNLNLNQSNFNTKRNSFPSPPVSAIPKAAFTPVLERAQEHLRVDRAERKNESANQVVVVEEVEVEAPYFPLPPPTRPEIEVARTPATRMYWHQPPTHGMMATGPLRRSHSIAQIGPTVYVFGGSDGKHPKATNTVYIFDTGMVF